MEPLYKIVGPNGECLNGGRGSWSLPHDGLPGEWWEVDGPIEACRNGLHVVTAAQLPHWYREGAESVVYQVETEGELLDHGNKWVARKARLLPRSKPVPDFGAARARLDRALARARRREISARKLRAVAIPDHWAAYLASIGSAKLPAGHPGAMYQVKRAEAEAAYAAAMVPVNEAVARAEAAYAATIRKGIMP